MQINIKIILDAVNILKMKQEGKNLIIKRIEIIHKLFDNFQLYRKKIENIKSKNLVNNQIYEEVRRRLGENKKFYDEKISDINSLMKKKVIILKKVQKKFLEIQIYIRRESQNFFGFRKQFANFSITPFILENEYLNRYKMKLNENLQDKINEIKILYIPIKEIKKKEKEKKEKKNINNDIDNKNSINIINLNNLINLEETGEEKLKKYIINQENDIKYNENKKLNLLKLKLVYKSKFVPRKKNGFKNEINLNINLNISRDTLNNNELSMINNNENLESNINNTFYDLFTVESLAKSNMQNSTFMRDEV
jgi:hypothetical protein